jgi:predicted acyltransferase
MCFVEQSVSSVECIINLSADMNAKRLSSIDALRGFDMFWISSGDAFFVALFTFINTPFFLHLATQLDHPAWAGFRFYDIIFPLFLFIMGIVMPLSITRRLEHGDSRKQLYRHIIQRTLLLFLLGLIYNGLFNLDFSGQRYSGVLQRFAVTYFFASIIVMNFKNRGQMIWIAAILLIYWLILLFIPAPGFHAYDLTPQGNLCGYIDRLCLPGSFCCYTHGDNEGILTMFPAIANVLLGVLAGRWLLGEADTGAKIKNMVLAGIFLIGGGLLWSLVFPINKYLWTGSYVFLTSGISFMLLCLFYWIIDVKGYRKWAFPFIVIGLNPIIIYVAQGVFDFGIIANIFIHGFIHSLGSFSAVFYQFSIILVKWFFLYFLYRKRIFLKV